MTKKKDAQAEKKTEVEEKTMRRRFSKQYKLRILERVDQCTEPGSLGKLLRQEGLYASYISNWRGLRKEGALEALGERKRGPKVKKTAE